MSDYLEFDPAIIEKRQVYRLLTGAVVPRPIGWASTLSKNDISNLAPFSFFTVVCVIPPMISLTSFDGSIKQANVNGSKRVARALFCSRAIKSKP